MKKELFAVAGGHGPADLVIINGKLVNVYSGEIYDGGVAVCGDTIAAIGDVEYTIGKETKIVDANGNYIMPGFIDGHIHPESTSLSIGAFAEIVLKHGTTAIVTDFHEVGVVGGLEAIEAVLEEAEATDLGVHFVVPSHVPFSPNLETSGGSFDAKIIEQALSRADATGLSECVGPYILAGFPELLTSMEIAYTQGKVLHGHLPHMEGPALNLCTAAGISTDHESLSGEEMVMRLRNGIHVMIREGSVARGLTDGLQPILEKGLDTTRVSIVTDDLHTVDVVKRGHLDDAVRTACEAGVDFIKAIQMVTVNAAKACGLDREIGGLAPGKRADINITTGVEAFRVLSVIAGGKVIVDQEKLLVAYPKATHAPVLLNTVKRQGPVKAEDFQVKVSPQAKKVRVKVMDTLPWIPITQERVGELAVQEGIVQSDVGQDILYIAQVERYGKNGNIGKAFMGGFQLKEGAIASSVGHDNHNIIVLGTNHEDMAVAVNRVMALQGGQVAVSGGEVRKEIPYPVLGLLSDLSAEALAKEKEEMNGVIWAMGSEIPLPFMFLSFICLAAIPDYAVTDHGFIDVLKQEVINPVLEVILA